jgi:hypothetical protein
MAQTTATTSYISQPDHLQCNECSHYYSHTDSSSSETCNNQCPYGFEQGQIGRAMEGEKGEEDLICRMDSDLSHGVTFSLH